MKVSYGRLYSLGNFENEKIEFEDEVLEGESIESAYQRAREVVEAQHVKTVVEKSLVKHERDELWRLRNEVATAEKRAREVVGYWRRAVKKHGELRELLAKHGVELAELDSYYLPPPPSPEPGELADGDEMLVICPHCGENITFLATSASSGPEPECEPGFLCPACREFIPNEE